MAATMEAHHGLIQDVEVKSDVLRVLVKENKFNIDASSNLLFLPRNFDLADATGTARHASNHVPISDAQVAIFVKFGKQVAFPGMTYGELLIADPTNLDDAAITLRTQIMDKAAALAHDVQDVTNKAIISGELPLTRSDPKYKGLATDAEKDAAFRADIDKVYDTRAVGRISKASSAALGNPLNA